MSKLSKKKVKIYKDLFTKYPDLESKNPELYHFLFKDDEIILHELVHNDITYYKDQYGGVLNSNGDLVGIYTDKINFF